MAAVDGMTALVLTALAAWRLAHLLVYEDGPGAVFAKLRYRAGLRYVVRQGADGKPEATRTAANWLAEGLTCLWCVSVWTATGLVVLGALLQVLHWSRLYDTIILILAASAGAVILAETVDRLRADKA